MSKRRKRKSTKAPKLPGPLGVDFDIEEDAEDIFMRHLAEDPMQVPVEKVETKSDIARRRKKEKKSLEEVSLDLHGLTVAEAQSCIDRLIQKLSAGKNPVILRIITGRGLHSGSTGGVLIAEIYSYVHQRYRQRIVQSDGDPNDVKIDGVPIRGWFRLWLKF